MNLLILFAGTLLILLFGWLVLVNIEGRNAVLTKPERAAWSVILGTTLMMLIVFLAHILGAVSFTAMGFILPVASLSLLLFGLGWKRKILWPNVGVSPPITTRPKWQKTVLIVLIVWVMIKLLAGAYQMWNVPTYWDDSFNNWNMRGKVFYETTNLELEYDLGNEATQTIGGVSSYPPTVPMAKAWMSTLRGSWEEPIVNGIHFVWFLALLGILGFWMRRKRDAFTGWLAVYILTALPLVLIHGVNPYADIFVGAHVLLAVISVFEMREAFAETLRSWLLLGALSIGALIFTKNEALLLYAPALTLLLLWELFRKKSSLSHSAWVRMTLGALGIIAAIALPWLIFKWMNGLTFGNAKGVTNNVLAFNQSALQAIWFSLTTEPNLLLLPVITLGTLMLKWRKAFGELRSVTIFVLFALVLQFFIFTFIPALATEAINQTGLARGMVQIAPSLVLLLILLWSSKPEISPETVYDEGTQL